MITENQVGKKENFVGLTDEQVSERVSQGLSNVSVIPPYKTGAQIIFSNVFTYFNFIFVAFAVLLIIVGSYKSLTFVPVIVLNSLIGIVQEFRAKKILDKLTIVSAPKATVIRNGNEMQINSEELVRDDIVVFGAGNQICADGIVVGGQAKVNESLLTGESTQIIKNEGDKLLSGSFVTSGRCIARLEKVGAESYASRLAVEAKKSDGVGKPEMMRSLDKIIKFVGIVLIPIGVALMLISMLVIKNDFKQSVDSTVAALIGMVPEGLYLLASVALVMSAVKLAYRKVLTHDMKCIEALARVDVLCVDKTGTITSPEMAVNTIVPLNDYDADKYPSLEQAVGDFANWMYSDNETALALKRYFDGRECSVRKADNVTAFSPEFKYSSVTFGSVHYVMGSPEFLLRDKYESVSEQGRLYFETGLRVLLFGTCENQPDGNEIIGEVTPLGLIVFENPVREGAYETFKYFDEQGVEIKVISGDNPLTVSLTAQRAGIKNADKYVDASTLTTPEKVSQALRECAVFGRVTPEQKREFIRELKAQGRTVAMTGDGVNDVLALKDADCSIAMASGSDAAAQASQLVLLDSDFSAMPSVVLEGRRVVNNIRRAGSLFLVKNIFSILTALLSIFAAFTYPLIPSQITLVSVFTIGAPGFLFALETDKNRITENFILSVVKNAVPAGITDFLLVGALMVLQSVIGFPIEQISTAATFILCAVGVVMLCKTAQPLNLYRAGIIVVMIIGIILAASILWSFLFDFVALSLTSLVVTVCLSLASIPLMICFTNIIRFLEKRFNNVHS
ncbi:MAG: HAD-IC family P-type ATPase [Clostridia bacterium]|nr:HAD-IC family P-type ATPase [Clostridia bacterium]